MSDVAPLVGQSVLIRVVTIKKTAIFLIVTPIFCQMWAKTGLLESYNQEISGFIDRNPVNDLRGNKPE